MKHWTALHDTALHCSTVCSPTPPRSLYSTSLQLMSPHHTARASTNWHWMLPSDAKHKRWFSTHTLHPVPSLLLNNTASHCALSRFALLPIHCITQTVVLHVTAVPLQCYTPTVSTALHSHPTQTLCAALHSQPTTTHCLRTPQLTSLHSPATPLAGWHWDTTIQRSAHKRYFGPSSQRLARGTWRVRA
jgi:hypothetical protein